MGDIIKRGFGKSRGEQAGKDNPPENVDGDLVALQALFKRMKDPANAEDPTLLFVRTLSEAGLKIREHLKSLHGQLSRNALATAETMWGEMSDADILLAATQFTPQLGTQYPARYFMLEKEIRKRVLRIAREEKEK